MNASQKRQSLKDGLAHIFANPIQAVEFTDGFGQVYAGISALISPSEPLNPDSASLPVTVVFSKIMMVRIEREWNRAGRYVPAFPEPRQNIVMKFNVVDVKPASPDGQGKIHVRTFEPPEENLLFSSCKKDFETFDTQVLGIEKQEQT